MSKKQKKHINDLHQALNEKEAYCSHHLERRRQAEYEVQELRKDVQAAEKEAECQKSFAQQMAKRNVNLDRAFKKYRFAVAHGAGALKLQEIVDELKSTQPDRQANRPIGPMPSPQELREFFIKGTETGRYSSKRPNFTEVNRPLSPEVVNQYVSDIKKDAEDSFAEDSFDCLGPQMAAYHGIDITKTQTIKDGANLQNIPPSMLKQMRDMYDNRYEHLISGSFRSIYGNPGEVIDNLTKQVKELKDKYEKEPELYFTFDTLSLS